MGYGDIKSSNKVGKFRRWIAIRGWKYEQINRPKRHE